MVKVKIQFPNKKISERKIKNFFLNIGLKSFISKINYYIDGYEVTKKDLVDKKKDKKNNFDIRLTKNPQPPELRDLYRLYQFIVLNKRTTVFSKAI